MVELQITGLYQLGYTDCWSLLDSTNRDIRTAGHYWTLLTEIYRLPSLLDSTNRDIQTAVITGLY